MKLTQAACSIRNTIFCLLLLFVQAQSTAQKFGKYLIPNDSYGILAGYHLRNGGGFVELGISNYSTVHSFWKGRSLTVEYGNLRPDQHIFGLTASAWTSFALSVGIAASYYTDFQHARSFSIRPMIGAGVMGVQIVYGYDLHLLWPNYDFGNGHRLSLRMNVPVVHPRRGNVPKF